MRTFTVLAACALSFQAYADEITFNNGKKYSCKNKYGEALTTCDIADIKLKLVELEGKPIKLVFYHRYDIKQVNTNEYQVDLYDKELNSVNMIFPAVALSYVRQVMERFVASAVSKKKTEGMMNHSMDLNIRHQVSPCSRLDLFKMGYVILWIPSICNCLG